MQDTPLVDAKYLMENLDSPQVKIIDIRGKWGDPPTAHYENYQQGHIPGAVYLDWTKEFITTTTKLEVAPVPDHDSARASFAAMGISSDDTVVLYDDYNHMFASRLWWVMRYFGHTNVKILNGAWDYWKAQGFPVSTEPHSPGTGDYIPQENPQLRVTVDQVVNRSGNTVLLDGRGLPSYTGTPDDPRSGHIPGAVNVPFKGFIDEQSGLFKDDQEINRIFSGAGIDIENPTVISSCGSGYAGAVVVVALKIIGIDAPLYDGSFSEWKSDPARPVEQV